MKRSNALVAYVDTSEIYTLKLTPLFEPRIRKGCRLVDEGRFRSDVKVRFELLRRRHSLIDKYESKFQESSLRQRQIPNAAIKRKMVGVLTSSTR
ncbi:hypothetical protein J6590_032105 [Homalodisca vitripennis]|nr:hypothetical protein J6590_032105 [Homalodisca vitripennis]